MIDWDKILDDFAHKCGDGGPDMTNPRHLALLRESLIKSNTDFNDYEIAVNALVGNLREGEKKYSDNAKNRALGRVGLPWGSKGTPPEKEEPKDDEGGEVELSPELQELEEKYSSEEPFHCSQPWEMPIIDVEGNIVPCGSPVREHTKDFILGNLHKGDTIKSCWNGEKMKSIRSLHEKGEWYKNPMCRVCVKSMRDEGCK